MPSSDAVFGNNTSYIYSATCSYINTLVSVSGTRTGPYQPFSQPPWTETRQTHAAGKSKKILKKNMKAEAKACQLMTDLIGKEQGAIYRRTRRAITKPGNHFWIVGDIFNYRYGSNPFVGKPDVIRIDDADKLYYTNFCVDQLATGQTPYTDKVISFLTNLTLDEKNFKKTINRISEGRLNNISECALWKC